MKIAVASDKAKDCTLSDLPVNTAVNCYLGKDGHQRVNCAQAVLNAFQKRFALADGVVQSFAAYGGGRAPEGLCGAVYAVKYLARHKMDAGKVTEFEQNFINRAGSVKCREIKGFKRFSCLECVKTCARFLAQAELETEINNA